MSPTATGRCFFAGIARHLHPYADPLRMLLGRNGSRRGTIPFSTLIHALSRIKLTPRREELRDDFQPNRKDD